MRCKGSNPEAAPLRLEGPLSALCSRWLTAQRMGEDAPEAALHDWPRSPAPMTVGGATDRADRLADRARSS